MENLKTKSVLYLFWLFILTVTCNLNVSGNQIGGIVMNQNHQLIPDALIICGNHQLYTDANGKFEIDADMRGELLYISKKDYNSIVLASEKWKKDSILTITLVSQNVLLLNANKNIHDISEAVSFFKGSKLENLPGTNRLNSFSGYLPGLLVMQRDGQPGWEDATISVRGQNTIGVLRNDPTILIDGYEGDFSMLNPYDIESITVLKDAASTAMYGLRSGNGVILVNTKKGSEGDLRVNVSSQTSVSKPGNFPKVLDAGAYAELYNEAMINDGFAPKYSSEEIATYKGGSDPLRYPDNDYINDYFSKSFIQTRNNVNIYGGSESVKYYFSMGHLYNSGLFNTEESENDYKTNTNLNVLNLHGNIDLKVTDKFAVSIDIKAKKDKRTQPGTYINNGVSNYIGQMMGTPPNAYPIFLASDSLGGNADFKNNFYGQLNNSGYSIWERYYLSGYLNFKYDLDFAPGLSIIGGFGYNAFGDHITDRSKSFAVYESMTASGTINKLGDDSPMINSSNLENINRYFNTEVGVTYSAKVGGSSIESKLIAERRMNELSVLRIPHWYKGLKGRLDYGLNSTYFASFVFSYQGSEQFPSGNRYGFFPALSLGWVVLNQEAVHVKLRGSAGITGNDFDSFTSPAYFAYLERFGEGDNFRFGTDVQTAVSTLSKLAEENEDITWSKTKKYDLGFDASLIGNALSVTADYFFERTDDILVGGTPGVLGMNYLYPFGVVENKGIEGIVTWSQKLPNDFNFYLSANGTYAKSKIIDQNEEVYEYEWQFRTGHPVGSLFGYVFDRFITEKDNINSLPDQSRLGSLIPGSLKYKDLNNDNVIDEKDISYMGTGNFPEIWYGFSGGFDFKGFDFNFHLTGIANRTIMYAGDFAFAMNGKTGSVNEWHLERWQQGDGQNATYPGLSILNFGNNMVPSDFWTANGNFLRLQSVQLGYTFSKGVVKKLGLENLRLFVNCSNLMTWSDVKQIDPAGQGSGASYPISPTCTGGFNLSF